VHLDELLDLVVEGFEVVGVAILVIGGIIALATFVRDVSSGSPRAAYEAFRSNVGRTILLGLEVLIIADIVLTVAIDQTFESAVTLAIIVLVRTFLSFSLEIELDGVVPWRKRAATLAAAEAGIGAAGPAATDG
jgi:uncharacterized membrane protein